jgi:hypothetical protein
METLILNQTEFPTLSTWEPNLLNEVLENLSQTANPSKTEITKEDKLWAATMLEMDLQAQGAIWETSKRKIHFWSTTENDEENEGRKHSVGGIISGRTLSDRTGSELNTSHKNNEDVDILISKYKGQKVTNEQVAEVVSAACFVSRITKLF